MMDKVQHNIEWTKVKNQVAEMLLSLVYKQGFEYSKHDIGMTWDHFIYETDLFILDFKDDGDKVTIIVSNNME